MVLFLDYFGGAGGWEAGAATLGVTGLGAGIETNADACATARAAGFERWQRDVRDLTLPLPVGGTTGSPPCQTMSPAGPGKGRPSIPALVKAARLVAHGDDPGEAVERVRAESAEEEPLDVRTVLTLEPLRVIRDGRPVWAALEQVPTVLPVWKALVDVLDELGYDARAEVLHAEQYGTPQARDRAVLVAVRRDVVTARRLGGVPWAVPTHSRYHRQSPTRLDPGVLPWVSMADGLAGTGWTPTHAVPGDSTDLGWVYRRPSPTMVGTFRPDVVAAPGYRKAGDPPRQRTPGSVLVSVEQAGVLQGFPADFPWQGSEASRRLQIGNAVPVQLAAAVLKPLLPLL